MYLLYWILLLGVKGFLLEAAGYTEELLLIPWRANRTPYAWALGGGDETPRRRQAAYGLEMFFVVFYLFWVMDFVFWVVDFIFKLFLVLFIRGWVCSGICCWWICW